MPLSWLDTPFVSGHSFLVMGFNAQPRRLLVLTSLLALFGCTTPKPAPIAKPVPPVTVTQPPKLVPPPPGITPPVVPKLPPQPTVLTLSDGPWTECTEGEAKIAVVATVRTNGLFPDQVGVHYLHPALKTIYRLVQLRSNKPVTLAQKEIPEACSSTFHLTNHSVDATTARYTIHSTLKQIPVDPSRAITLNLRVNFQQNGVTEHLDESVVLNGLSRTECGKGTIMASIEILSPETAALRLAAPSTSASPIPLNSSAPTAEPTVAQTEWDLLHKKFHLTGQETRVTSGFMLTGDASIQFPDILFSCDQIHISKDQSLMKLHGPVHIEWDGRSMTAEDATIRVTPDTVQFESGNIKAN
jgi:hypothetical protein